VGVKMDEYRCVLEKAFRKHYAEKSDIWTGDDMLRVVPALIQGFIKLPKKTRFLDIGCGTGSDVEYFASIVQFAVGIDLIASDKWRLVQARVGNAVFYEVEVIEFESDDKFDLILDNGCFHHQDEGKYEGYFEKVSSLLADNGFFAVCTFKKAVGGKWIDGNGRIHRYFMDDEIHLLLARFGFSVKYEVDLFRKKNGEFYRLTIVSRVTL
jgi:SAM-dependent methyltransferase